jgi:membrane dipeptidase
MSELTADPRMATETVQLDEERFGVFDFSLAPADEQRARQLHGDSLIVDCLYWGPLGYRDVSPEMEEELREAAGRLEDRPVDFVHYTLHQPLRWAARGRLPGLRPAFEASGVTAGTVQIITSTYEQLVKTTASALAAFDALDWLVKATREADILRAKESGGHALVLRTQPVLSHSRDLELIDAAYDLGLRVCQLTYNVSDFVGGGCLEPGIGLTSFGKQLVSHLNSLGAIVDLAHGGRQTTLDACSASEAPVICSHTSLSAVYPHARAKDDDELEAIAETGGVIGILGVPFFLGDGKGMDITAMLDHLDHAVSVVGHEHVAIGTDWPNYGPKWMFEKMFKRFTAEMGFREEHGFADASKNLIGFDDYRDFPNITRGLVARGYSDEQITAILGGNFLRVFGEVCG